ncbi:DUF3786 domain-containing protein [Thermodesulforhabdus norvegica]|uniref:DUF3786 domain-containing protein n=1 Tax=Thermodesulforhabdus norvegica TaxID=39841 RepID=A0A1I4RBH2_9BACT|nr:DUF3786 domain-containing protein [Thermodesulforhabdus norvegica]SFM49555.1 protein of unknown function [Thermodesulforhabdus norvegica]
MESQNYHHISLNYLRHALERDLDLLAKALPGSVSGGEVTFRAFGHSCRISREGVFLGGRLDKGPRAIIISIYALNVPEETVTYTTSWTSFRELPGTMPYWGPFRKNVEEPLLPYVPTIHHESTRICETLDGYLTDDAPGDFAMVLFPLPKVPLLYVFSLPDEEFPAEAKCLYAKGSTAFMPVDVLADLAEHTSRRIVEIISGEKK